jgi:Mg2+/Co2+ transporter CorC
MNDDRSRSEPHPPAGPGERAREPWYDRFLHLVRLRGRDSIRDDLEDALAETAADPDFSPQERAMLKNVLGFHRVRVDDVMVPRADIVAVPVEWSLGELWGTFRTAGHSRLPVYGETLDDPKGMVHIRDFLDHIAAKAETGSRRRRAKDPVKASRLGDVDLSATIAAARILRPVIYVPRSMPALDLLVRMQTTRTHMALVIDEYGGTDGLVSIEDLVEAVVGDIEDEHDNAAARLILNGDGDTFVADARASLEEVSEALGVDLAAEDTAEEVDTLGGLVVTLAGRVPSRGELIAGPNQLEFEVLDADPRRIKRLRIHRREASVAGAANAAPGANGTVGGRAAPAANVAGAANATANPAPGRGEPGSASAPASGSTSVASASSAAPSLSPGRDDPAPLPAERARKRRSGRAPDPPAKPSRSSDAPQPSSRSGTRVYAQPEPNPSAPAPSPPDVRPLS